MKNVLVVAVAFLLFSSTIAQADISVTDRTSAARLLGNQPHATGVSAQDRAARHAAAVAENQAKRDAKRARRGAHAHGLNPRTQSLHPHALATGSIALIDASGMKYFINTDITFSTSSSASGAASEASYTQAVSATTLNGGVTTSTLNDMFDGYNAICVSLTNATGPCETGNASYAFFNQTGAPAAFDTTVPAGPNCTSRQISFPTQAIGPLSVTRKVYVPPNDTYARWMNYFTNTSGSPVTFTMITGNNLGSDNNTLIVSSSNGDTVAQTTDTWVSTFQNYSGTTSSDPRIGHVLQGTGAPTPVSFIHFADGDDNPYWAYTITLAPGQTKAILNFATGQPSKAAANAKAASLATLPATSTQCLSATELGEITNFLTSTDLSISDSSTAPTAFGNNPFTYTLAVTNLGPSPAASVSVATTLPAGSSFVSASGTGWTCNNVAGVVTCTAPSLPVGAAPPISLTITAPNVSAPGTLGITSAVSSATADPNPANNVSTYTLPLLTGSQIPAVSTWGLMMLAAMLAVIALARRT